jgi:hypothetical protein
MPATLTTAFTLSSRARQAVMCCIRMKPQWRSSGTLGAAGQHSEQLGAARIALRPA